MTHKTKQQGQGLVEFALVLPIFLALMAGILDGCRLLFTYNELQEAARVGARWGAVEVGRDSWNNSTDPGNSGSNLQATGYPTNSIVGQVSTKLVAVDGSHTFVSITTPTCPKATGAEISGCSGKPVTVQVAYTFRPVLTFGLMGITLVGKATEQHE
jgi:Flp pilus assembly protein TadG